MPRPGNAGWAGTSDGVAARGFVNGRGPPRSGGRESTAGAHRSEVPARRQTRTHETVPARRQTRPRKHGPCPQADSDAERRRCPQADAAAGNPPQAESAAETLSTRYKKRVPTHR